MNKTTGRPKIKHKRKRLNLTISDEGIKKGRFLAEKSNKSLSAYTEEQYISTYHKVKGYEKLEHKDIIKLAQKITIILNLYDEIMKDEE